MTEFNLSDKIYYNGVGISQEDVKEFIRLLKENLVIPKEVIKEKNWVEKALDNEFNRETFEIIDKLAGEKLI